MFKNFYRSMLGQLFVLTLVFLLAIIGFLVIQPMIEYSERAKPLESTLFHATRDLSMFAFAEDDNEEKPKDLATAERLLEVKKYNPNFQYYLRVNEDVYASNQAKIAKWAELLDLPNIDQLSEKITNEEDCARVSFSMPTEDEFGIGRVYSSLCGKKEVYYEISGIENPVPRYAGFFNEANQDWLWWGSRDLLITAGGIFVLAFIVVFITTRSIRKVATVAQSFDPDDIDHALPEKGLPSEVLPLVQAVNQMINKVDEAKEQQNFFLSTAAHEMRTPLAILRTRLEELPDSNVKTEIREDVKRVNGLVNQLLRLMRIKGPGELTEQIDIVALCKKVIAERAPKAIHNEVELSFNSQLDDLVINGDAHLFEVVVANLIDNAVSFSQSGDIVEIIITSDKQLVVRDQGPGVSEAILDSIFEPFAKNPPNRDGHGLGLAIVKAIVHLHKGKISVCNSSSAGAEFTVQL